MDGTGLDMKRKLTFAIGLCLVSALVAPGINAAAHADASGRLTPTVTTPTAVVSPVSPGVLDATEREDSSDKTTTVTAHQCPDGEIYLTVTHVFLVPPGAKNSPPPPGGYDKLPEYSPEASCESGKSTK